MQEKYFFTNKRVGLLMLFSVILSMLLMLLHPEAIQHDPNGNTLFKWVHGILILLLICNAYGLSCFTGHSSNKGNDTKLGMLFYYVGLGSLIFATASGFVQTSLVENLHSQPELFSSLNKLSLAMNQTYAKLGIFGFGLAGISLLPMIQCENGATRSITIIGGIVGATLILIGISGTSISVTLMTALTVLIMIWHGLIGWWLTIH